MEIFKNISFICLSLGSILFTNYCTGQTLSFKYDMKGQLTEIQYPDSTHINYLYDEEGNRLSVDISKAITSTKPLVDENIQNIRLFPNPVNDRLYAEIYFSGKSEALVKVIDVYGRMLLVVRNASYLPANNLLHIDVGGLAPGLYYFICETEHGRMISKFIVIH